MCRILIYGCSAVVKDIVTDNSGTIISCKHIECSELKEDDIKNEKFDTEIVVSHTQFPESHKLTFIHVPKDETPDTKDDCVTENPVLVENYEEHVEAFVSPEIKVESTFGQLNFLPDVDTNHEGHEDTDVKEEVSDPIHINESGSSKRKQCRKCGAVFYKLTLLLKHHKKEHGKLEYFCDFCDKGFKQEKQLISHMKFHVKSRELQGEPPYTCEKCFKVCKQRQSFIAHMKSHLKCDQCIQEFSDEDELNEHKLIHPEEKTFECSYCDKSYKNIHHLNVHLKYHQKKVYKCSKCTKTFALKCQLKSHKDIHLSEQRAQLEQQREQQSYVCEICGKAFRLSGSLKAHLETHSTSILNCDQCDETFNNKFKLKKHIKIHQAPTTEQLFACDICRKEFKHKSYLQSHQLIHQTNRVKYPCTMCDKTLSRKQHLQRHIKDHHNNIRNHHCEYCDSTFKKKQHLTRHMALHMKYGDRKFSRNRSQKMI